MAASASALNAYPEGGVSEFQIKADAADEGIADVSIGNIDISADGDDAVAALAYSEFSGVDGEITAEAGESGTADLTIGDISVTATAFGDAKAMLLHGGRIQVDVDESLDNRSDLNIKSDADQDGTSNLAMGNISVSATSALGEADGALVYSTNYVADLDIYADAEENAIANLTLGNILVSAEAIAGGDDVTASLVTLTDGSSGYAYLDITAEADDHGDANVTIGNIEVTAKAYAGNATATLLSSSDYASLDITADASDEATASVTINSIDVKAVASGGEASAFLVKGEDTDINIGVEAYDTQSFAELNIVNGIHVAATSSGDAYASLVSSSDYFGSNNGRIFADASEDGIANVTIKNLHIHAVSYGDSADARFSNQGNFEIIADSDGDGDDSVSIANITITEGISVKATAVEEAHAEIDDIISTASDYGTATVTIGDIEVIAAGTAENVAIIDTIRVDASDYGDAEMTIGEITVTAGVFNEDWQDGFVADSAYTHVDLSVDATNDSTAILEVGNITLVSDASGGTQGSAYAALNIDVRAGESNNSNYYNDDSYAYFKAGDINVTSLGLSAGEDSASIDIFAGTSNYDANAVIDIGNITLTSQVDIHRDIGPFGEALSLNIQASTNYGDNATVNVGNININLEGDAASLGIVNIGEAGNASVFGFPSGSVVDNDYDQINIGNLNAYIEDEGSLLVVDINRVMWDQERYAAFSGDGVVVLGMDTGENAYGDNAQMTFGKIFLADMDMDQDGNIDVEADFDGLFWMNFGFDIDKDIQIPDNGSFTFEESVGTPGLVPHTTIYGYDISNGSSISFNGITADDSDSQFVDLNISLGSDPETDVDDLWTSLANEFDNSNNVAGEDNLYVYRLFDERAGTNDDDTDDTDINGDGYFSSRLGVLAYDQELENDGSLTAIVFLNDLNGSLDEQSISGGTFFAP